jgi:hypothetical protein
METRVVNIRFKHYDTYIGRGSRWGNPFRIGKDGDRFEVVLKYYTYLLSRPDLIQSLPTLRGHRLGCYCSPELCHGEVLVALLEALF